MKHPIFKGLDDSFLDCHSFNRMKNVFLTHEIIKTITAPHFCPK